MAGTQIRELAVERLRGGSQDYGRVAPDDDGVLDVGRQTRVGRRERPTVVSRTAYVRSGRSDDRLNRDHKSFGQPGLVACHVIVRDARFLMDLAPDAMAAELREDMESGPTHLALYRPADLVQTDASPCRRDRASERKLGDLNEPCRKQRHFADPDANRSIRHIAVEFGRYVEFDQVAIVEGSRGRDTMYRLVVDADAVDAGKTVCQLRGGPCAESLEHSRTNFIQLACRHTSAYRPPHLRESERNNASSGCEAVQILL